MKILFVLFAILSQAAHALPVICESYEKAEGAPALRIKINQKVSVNMNGTIWPKHLIGVSPVGRGEVRTIVYGSGNIRPESINMSIVKDGWVYGYVDVKSFEKNGHYEGKIRIGGTLRGRVIDVRCTDENPPGELI